ncbi:hypothetical protein [Streptomyces sp. NPDC048392]|uniref:hypothetical protein n=1 Tax=Streptomyces sp. NPDC048392 TaxID=3365543 RepID=UPI003717DEF3
MSQNDNIMELVASYDTYMDASELDVNAVTDAPATTWYCAAVSVSLLTGATYEATC